MKDSAGGREEIKEEDRMPVFIDSYTFSRFGE